MSSSATLGADGRWFRDVLGNYPTGVTVITAIGEDGSPAGMAVGSFTSVSLNPPLVAFLPDKSSTSFPRIRTAGSFCVNILAAHQEPVCRAFASRGGDKFAHTGWSAGSSGAPRLDGVAAWVDCDFESIQEAGDHYLVIGRVRELHSSGEQLPLVFFQGGYGRFSSSSPGAVPEVDFVSHLRLADAARPDVERVVGEVGTECLAITSLGEQLVVLASAGTPGSGPSRVGQRIPFVPPIGTPFVAWADEATQVAWLSRAGRHISGTERDRYAELLNRVRRRGWSLSLGNDQHTELLHAIDRYSAGDLSMRADVQRLGSELVHRFEPAELDPSTAYDIRLVSAPVFGPDGSVALMLTLSGLPHPSTGADLSRYLDVVSAAALRITDTLGGSAPFMAGRPRPAS